MHPLAALQSRHHHHSRGAWQSAILAMPNKPANQQSQLSFPQCLPMYVGQDLQSGDQQGHQVKTSYKMTSSSSMYFAALTRCFAETWGIMTSCIINSTI